MMDERHWGCRGLGGFGMPPVQIHNMIADDWFLCL